MHGKTTGWIGVGITPSGGMTDADIFVGWVKDGVPTITVRNNEYRIPHEVRFFSTHFAHVTQKEN